MFSGYSSEVERFDPGMLKDRVHDSSYFPFLPVVTDSMIIGKIGPNHFDVSFDRGSGVMNALFYFFVFLFVAKD